MASKGQIGPVTLLNQVISTGVVDSNKLDVRFMNCAAFVITYGAGIAANFAIVGSMDDVVYYDLQVDIQAASGSSGASAVNVPGIAFPYIKVRTTYTSGAGASVTIVGTAKGV